MDTQKPRFCPVCNTYYSGYPALSRKDNKTEICSQCGTDEALNDFFKKKDKEVKNLISDDAVSNEDLDIINLKGDK